MRRLKNFIIEHSSYGGKGAFSARGVQFYKIYLLAALIVLAALISSILLGARLSPALNLVFSLIC